MKHFTQYWKNSTWKLDQGCLLDHSASNEFASRGVRPGDRIYVVTVIHGVLFVGAVISVKQLVDQRQAERIMKQKLWPARDHAIATSPTRFIRNGLVSTSVAKRLRFRGDKRLLFKGPLRLDQQTMRGVRELTPASARMLLQVLQRGRRIENDNHTPKIAEELPAHKPLFEGARSRITVNAYERNSKARDECIKHYGYWCSVCSLLLEDRYGERAREFIHVHHVKPLSEIRRGYRVDAIRDLRPVCPNCHAIIHRSDPALTLSRARRLVRMQHGDAREGES